MSGLGYVRQVEEQCRQIGIGRIATVCGRFWAMDRDNRWDRVSKAYAMLTGRKAEATAPSAEAAVQAYYDKPFSRSQTGDEFIVPTWVVGPDGKPAGLDRATATRSSFTTTAGDRPREITKAFVLDGFNAFDRGPKLDLYYATMTAYEEGLPVHVIPPKPEKLKHILGEVVSDAGIAQFRCAETEKNPHVTFFFNNYRAEPFPGEDRACPPSPKVATYDQQPEMSAAEVTEAAKDAILSGNTASSSSTTPTPTWSATPARCRRRSRRSRRPTAGWASSWRRWTKGRPGRDLRRPRQLRADVGSREQRRPHLAHPEPGRGLRRWRGLRRRADQDARRAAGWPTSPRPCST